MEKRLPRAPPQVPDYRQKRHQQEIGNPDNGRQPEKKGCHEEQALAAAFHTGPQEKKGCQAEKSSGNVTQGAA